MIKKKLWIRILAAVLAFGLLWIVAWMTLSFTGDPISAAMSQRAAKDYIQQSNLRTMGFELSRVSDNFKFGGVSGPARGYPRIIRICVFR